MASFSVSSISSIICSNKLTTTTTTLTDSSSCSFAHNQPSRRNFLKGLALLAPFTLHSPLPLLAKEVAVGSYLPQSDSDPGFVLFQASSKDTPALRAGTFQQYVVGIINFEHLKLYIF